MNSKSILRIAAVILLVLAFAFLLKQQHESHEKFPVSGLEKSLSNKQFSDALDATNRALRDNPQDPDLLLAKGIALAGLNQRSEAIALYRKMTRDFPDLIEPYNNLATLLAADGQHDQARQVLEKAIQSQGSYATAYKNLNTVYAKLADEAYSKALDVSTEKNPAPLQMNLLTRRTPAGDTPPVIALSAVTPPKPVVPPVVATKEPTPTVIEPPTEKPAILASAEKVTEKPAVKPVELPPSNTTPPADKPAAAPAKADKQTEQAVASAVQAWAAAWSKQDIKQYLAHYANNFAPDGQSHAAWESDRRARISGKSRISVSVSALVVNMKSATTASVKFRQSYQSDRLNSQTSKTLTLERKGDNWLIISEKAGG